MKRRGTYLLGALLGLGLALALARGYWLTGAAAISFVGIWFWRRKATVDVMLAMPFGLVILAFVGPWLAHHDPMAQMQGGLHPLGLDPLGRDIAARLLHGHRNSVFLALAGSLAANLLGLIAVALMRLRILQIALDGLMQVMLSVPLLLFYLIGLAFFDSGSLTLIALIAFTLWPEPARMLQASWDKLREANFVQAARMQGWSESKLFWAEIMPNLLPVLWANLIVTFTTAVVLESILSYLGVGLPIGTPSLGHLIQTGMSRVEESPHILAISLGLLVSWTLSLHLLQQKTEPQS